MWLLRLGGEGSLVHELFYTAIPSCMSVYVRVNGIFSVTCLSELHDCIIDLKEIATTGCQHSK